MSRESKNRKWVPLLVIALATVLVLIWALSAFAASKLSLDKKGRFGCIACHGDKRLVKKTKDKKTLSLYIDEETYAKSVHGKVGCLECHTDFVFRDHSLGVANYKKTAGLSCYRKCHKKQAKAYLKSIHGRLALSNDKKKGATCGDCHAYKIHQVSKTRTFKNDFFFNADKSCGKDKCHKKDYESYSDWYHGLAYKEAAADSPACWNCHGAHDVYAKNEVFSKTSNANLGTTCGVCHPGSANSFGSSYKDMIHKKTKQTGENFLIKYLGIASDVTGGATERVKGMYTQATEWIAKIYEFFFPESLRPLKEKSGEG